MIAINIIIFWKLFTFLLLIDYSFRKCNGRSTKYNTGNFMGAEFSIQKFIIIENLGKMDFEKHKIMMSDEKDNKNLLMIDLNQMKETLLPKRFRKN